MIKEGYWYGLPLVLIAGGLAGFWLRERSLPLLGLAIFFLALAVLVLNFFRDPDRMIPSDPKAIVSPADGKVVQIEEEDLDSRPYRRVSIFMSPFDAHINRSPISGTLQEVSYRKGAFRAAYQTRASIENEQNVFRVRGELGEVVVKQIAGVLARRIVFWRKPGDQLERGERVGMIKFGSRVDVLVDSEVVLQVNVGDHVRAGSSILGMVNQESAGKC